MKQLCSYYELWGTIAFFLFLLNKAQMRLIMILSNVHAYSFILECYKRLNISQKPKEYNSFTPAEHVGYKPLGKLLL